MTAPTITALPTAPSRADDSATFSNKADAFVAALPTFGTEANALGDYVETTAGTIETQAAAVAAASGLTSYQGAYAGGTAYTTGQSVSYDGRFWIADQATTGNTPTSPSAYWTYIGSITTPAISRWRAGA